MWRDPRVAPTWPELSRNCRHPADRLAVPVGVDTVYNFVRVRTAATKKMTRAAKATVAGSPQPTQSASPQAAKQDGDAEVWQRIQELKNRSVPAHTPGAEKVFHYDENVPLTVKSRKNDV